MSKVAMGAITPKPASPHGHTAVHPSGTAFANENEDSEGIGCDSAPRSMTFFFPAWIECHRRNTAALVQTGEGLCCNRSR